MTTNQEITVIDRARNALATVGNEQALQELANKFGDLGAINSSADHKLAMSAISELRTVRVNIEKAGKAARDDANAFSKAVIAEERRLIGFIRPEEDRLQHIRKDYEDAIERKKQEAARKEEERVAGIRARIDRIKDIVVHAAGKPSGEIKAKLDQLQAATIGPEFEEFQAEAKAALETAVANLETLHAETQAREQAEAESKAKAEAEAEQRQKEAKELARQRAEQEHQAAELRKQQEAIERQRLEAEAKIKAEQEELARQRADIERRQREADERKAQEEQAKAEAEAQARAEAEEEQRQKEAEAQLTMLGEINDWAKAHKVSQAALKKLITIIERHQAK